MDDIRRSSPLSSTSQAAVAAVERHRDGVLLVPAAESVLLGDLSRLSVEVVTFVDAGDAFVMERDGRSHRVDFKGKPLPFVEILGVVYSDVRHSPGVERLVACFERFPRKIEARRFSSRPTLSDFEWLFEVVVARSRRAVATAEAGQRQLSVLRDQFANLQESFSALEGFLSDFGGQPLVKVWEMTPTNETVSRPEDGTAWVQRLPVQSLGVAQLSLWIAAEAERVDDPLVVTLSGVETGEQLANWELFRHCRSAGWRSLVLPKSLAKFGLSLELEIRWGSAASEWRLGRSHRLVSPSGVDNPVHGVALQVYKGLPAVSPFGQPGQALQAGTPAPRLTLVVGDMLKGAVQLSASPPDLTYTLVGYMPDLQGLLVHPVRDGVTLAGLLDVCPDGACTLVLRVRHANPAGSPFLITARINRFALTPHDFRDEDAGTLCIDNGSSGPNDHNVAAIGPLPESAWQRVDPGETVRVAFQLRQPTARVDVLHLATRPIEHDAHNSWAIVETVEFHRH